MVQSADPCLEPRLGPDGLTWDIVVTWGHILRDRIPDLLFGSREEAIARMYRSLDEFIIEGIHTTIPFHLYMMKDERFLKSDYPITYIDQLIADGCQFIPEKE